MIIDIHTHILPEEVSDNPSAFAKKDDYFAFLTTPSPANHTEQRYATYQEAVTQMDTDGLDALAIQGWGMLSHELCVEQNTYTLEAMKAYPTRIIGFGIVHPKGGKKALDEVERCLAAGMAGIGEIDPYGQRFSLDDPTFLRICDMCIEAGALMNIHISETIGHSYFGKSDIPLNEYVALIKKKPDLQIIMAHYGGGLPYWELLPEVRQLCTNVYYDTAGSPLICSSEVYQATIRICGAHKVLFGTDYPLLLFPQVEQQPNFRSIIDEITAHVSSDEDRRALLGESARNLLVKNNLCKEVTT